MLWIKDRSWLNIGKERDVERYQLQDYRQNYHSAKKYSFLQLYASLFRPSWQISQKNHRKEQIMENQKQCPSYRSFSVPVEKYRNGGDVLSVVRSQHRIKFRDYLSQGYLKMPEAQISELQRLQSRKYWRGERPKEAGNS